MTGMSGSEWHPVVYDNIGMLCCLSVRDIISTSAYLSIFFSIYCLFIYVERWRTIQDIETIIVNVVSVLQSLLDQYTSSFPPRISHEWNSLRSHIFGVAIQKEYHTRHTPHNSTVCGEKVSATWGCVAEVTNSLSNTRIYGVSKEITIYYLAGFYDSRCCILYV